MTDDNPKKKPGPKADRLVIGRDTEEALDRLLDKQPEDETSHNWRRLDRYDKITTHGMAPGVMYLCTKCRHYARDDSVPGPCPPPKGSPKILD